MEQALLNVAQIFTSEINKLESKLAGAGASITLNVHCDKYNNNRPSIRLETNFYTPDGGHQTVRAASLGSLMDEVYRRAGFIDREALRLDKVEASLVALPSPQED